MQGTQEEVDNAITALVEGKLLLRIRDIYEDLTMTSQNKKEERKKYTENFIEMLAEELSMPESRIRRIVEDVILKAKWIKEIEELDEEIEDER